MFCSGLELLKGGFIEPAGRFGVRHGAEHVKDLDEQVQRISVQVVLV